MVARAARTEPHGAPPHVPARLPARLPGRDLAHAADVVVVGGGIVGLTAAWRAARAGASVTVLDPSPGDGATHAAAGMLAPVTEADFGEERLLRLNLASAALWPGFAADLEAASGVPVGLERSGTLALAFDADDAALLRRVLALHAAWGLGSTEVAPARARALEPLVGPRVAAAAHVPGDHQVDPRAVHRALRAALAAAGVAVVRRRGVRLVRAGGAVVGVHDDAGRRHAAGLVVLAAGHASGDLVADLPDVVVPTRPVPGTTLRLAAPPDAAPAHVLRGTVQGRPVYVVPRAPGPDGVREVVVGATQDERDDDRRPRAGGVFALLRDARALVPALDEADFVEATHRARPGTPDNLPLLGPSGVAGLLLATGHHRNGVLLTPVTAAAVDAALAGRPLPDAVAAVDPRRFSPSAPTEPRTTEVLR